MAKWHGMSSKKYRDKKIWVRFKEKFHGKNFLTWQRISYNRAIKDVIEWNQYGNPQEHLEIVGYSDSKPKGIKKTKFRGIYR